VIIVGIETATELVGVALADDDGPRGALWVTGRRRHAETLAPALAELLEHTGLAMADIDLVVVDTGPGLFTGLRVGVAVAKGIAQGLGVGVLGLSSLEVLARAAFDAGATGSVVPMVDARRGEVFAARYAREPGGEYARLRELAGPRLVAPQDLADELARYQAGNSDPQPLLVAAGDGALRYRDLLDGVPGLSVAGESLAGPSPSVLVALAKERLAAGATPRPPGAVVPDYLRDPDVRINWAERSVRAGGHPTGAGR
jgi:tRNA threonylcarbamoyladenosine biosynthesis protein TsaB